MKALDVKSILAVLAFAAITLVSCKKNNDDIVAPPAAAVEGQWIGKYASGNNDPCLFYGFNILPAGVLQGLKNDMSIVGVGTWALEGGQTFKAEYHYNGLAIYYNLAAKYNSADKTLNGSWGMGKELADDGSFFLDKQ